MEDFKSDLLEVVKYQNEQLLKLQERIEENQNEQQLKWQKNQNQQLLKFQERMEEKQPELKNLTLKLFADKNPTEKKPVFHKIPSGVQ